MRVHVLITVHMALLAATSGTELEHKKALLWKCCNVHQILSADGESCVEANWPSNFSIKRDMYGRIMPPLVSQWMVRWLPPGLPMDDIRYVVFPSDPFLFDAVSPVNASTLWDPALLEEEDLWRNTVAILGEFYIARPKPGGGFRKAEYCVDAALPPLGPFAMRFETKCSEEECAFSCCWGAQSMRSKEGHWQCENDAEGFWTPDKSTLPVFDPEFPHSLFPSCKRLRLLPFEKWYAEWALYSSGVHDFHFSTRTSCFGFHRSSNGSLREGLFYCDYPRIARGFYWLLRPLCMLSALLLAVSLFSIACNKSMRRKIHGRCLASHAVSLLAFNIGQTVYYLTISDRLDKDSKQHIPSDLQAVCKYFALSMYFVLTSAWMWLTSLCVNMARGFRLHITIFNKGSGKKFLVISAFAWGVPAALTVTCSLLFTQPKWDETPAWYAPSLMETRVCYIESLNNPGLAGVYSFIKSGTALLYYGPVCCLALCNVISLALTLRKVQYLKQGNSVLRREGGQILLVQRHTEGNNPPTAHTATGNGQTPEGRGRSGSTVDAKTIKLYIKMVLISGGIELLTEVIMWFSTHNNFSNVFSNSANDFYRTDRDLAYRAAGYVTDFFRAAIVMWLAAPEGGYQVLLMRMLRRDKREKKPAGAGNAGRRKHNVA